MAECKAQVQTALFKDPVRTALQTLFISVIKTNQFCCKSQKSLFVLSSLQNTQIQYGRM